MSTATAVRPDRTHSRPGQPRRPAAILLAILAVLAAIVLPPVAVPVVVLMLLATLWAVALADGERDRDGAPVVFWLPAGFVLALMLPLVTSIACRLLAIGAWNGRLAWLLLAASVAVPAAIGGVRGCRVVVIGRERAGAGVGALLLGFGMLVVALRPLSVWARNVGFSTDFDRHLLAVHTLASDPALREVPGEHLVHTAVGWLARLAGTGAGIRAMWLALAPVVWVMLVLVVMSCVMLARRAAALVGLDPSWAGVASACALGLALGSIWLGPMLYRGFVTSIAGALFIVVTLGCVLIADQDPRPAVVGAAAASVAVATTWQLLLPAAGLGGLVVVARWLHGLRPPWRRLGWAITAAGCLGALAVGASQAVSWSDRLVGPLLEDLRRPGVAGPILLLLALLLVLRLDRAGQATAAGGSGLMLGGFAATALFVGTVGGLSLQGMGYYLAKVYWTAVVCAIPLAAAALAWMGAGVLSRVRSGTGRRPVVVLAVAVAAVSLGAFGATRGHRMMATGYAGPVLQIPLSEYLEAAQLPGERPYLVLGIDPQGEQLGPAGRPGIADYVMMELPQWRGQGEALLERKIQFSALYRDLAGLCRWLEATPDALRITGPTGAGPQLLLAAGCSPAVVRESQWVQVGAGWLESPAPLGTGIPR